MIALACISLVLSALAIGAPLAHVLEMPVRRAFAVSADWTRLRDQWEFAQASRFGLFLLGFSALLASVLGVRSSAERRGETTG
jgi:hypothetical protein